ncbi:MAG: SdrD B-like domain-containing protein, partial [Bacteroidota bacterium]
MKDAFPVYSSQSVNKVTSALIQRLALLTVLAYLPILALANTCTPEHTNAVLNVPGTFATIQAAVNASAAGDEIVIGNGTYNESVNLNTAGGDITIRAANPGMVTVNGGTSRAFSVTGFTGNVTIDGLVLTSSMDNSTSGVISSINLTGRLTVSNCTFSPTAAQFLTDGIYCFSDVNNVPTQVSILNNIFGAFDNDQLIYIEAGDGNTTNADVDILIDGNTNTGVLEDDAVRVVTESSNSNTTMVITNNIFSGWTGSGAGLDVHIGFGGTPPTGQTARLLFDNNMISNTDGDGITLNLDGINTDIFAIISRNTITGNANTETGIFVDDDSSGDGIEATIFLTDNTISNTLQSGIRYRPFCDNPGIHDVKLVIDGNTITNPNSDNSAPTSTAPNQMTAPEEGGIDISDDSGQDDERYVVNAEITNNNITVTSANATCILVEEPVTNTVGTAVVNALISGNVLNGCAMPFIRGGVNTSVSDPVPSTDNLSNIGDLVWHDVNNNGIRDGGEPGIPGVTISYSSSGVSGSTATNGMGKYFIPALTAGTYTITATPTASFPFFTSQGAGNNGAVDSDFDPTSGTASVTLVAGVDNLNIDAGLTTMPSSVCSITDLVAGPVQCGSNSVELDQAFAEFTFNVSNGSGDYIILVTRGGMTTTANNPPPGQPTDGQITLPGQLTFTGSTAGEVVQVQVIDQGSATTCQSALIDVTLVTCPDECNPDITDPTASNPAPINVTCREDIPDPDPSVVTDAMDNCAMSSCSSSEIWINEFHYDNTGGDTGEFIEVAGPAGTDLSGYSIVLYNGSNGNSYGSSIALSGTIDDESNGFGALAFFEAGIQNGSPDGIALVNGSTVIEFLSYEGSFTANNGPASGITSVDVGVDEPGSTPIGQSLQLTGMGNMSSDFSWSGPATDSPGDLNASQSITACAVTGVTVAYLTEEGNGGA